MPFVGRLAQAELLQELLEALAVFGPVDGVGLGADDRHAGLGQAHGQVERGLAAELDDHPVRLSLSMMLRTSSRVSGSK
jgi:hypothetical protein